MRPAERFDLRKGADLGAFVVFHRRVDARVRLLCLPHAGGGASAYRSWAARLPPQIELLALQLPGRENRFAEPPLSRFGDLAESLLPDFGAVADRTYLLFGHSFGALLAHALVPVLAQAGVRAPAQLVLSGAAPRRERRRPLDDESLIAELRRLGGTPAQILEDRALANLALRGFRADLGVMADLDPAKTGPVRVPIATFAGRRDPVAPPDEVGAWERLTTEDCQHHVFEGGHFFLHAPASPTLLVLVDLCKKAMSARLARTPTAEG